MIDPQNEVLSETGLGWPLLRESLHENNTRKQKEERVRRENVRLEERTRIAQELHDTLLQTFLSASMQLSLALDNVPLNMQVKPQLDRVLRVMRQGIEEGRNTILDLRSDDSHPFDLVVALSSVQQELAVGPEVDFHVSVSGRQQHLQPFIRHEIYRIGREALVNAFSHSKAKRIEFELDYSNTDFSMRIWDNGCGIDPQVLRDGRDGHWGLAGMRERATRIGGVLNISSSAVAGTDVRLSVSGDMAFEATSKPPLAEPSCGISPAPGKRSGASNRLDSHCSTYPPSFPGVDWEFRR